MSIVRWDPFRSLREDDFFRRFEPVLLRRPDRGDDLLAPAVDVSETDGEVTVTMEVPGVTKDQLDVTVAEGSVSVKGEVREEKEERDEKDEKKSYHRREIRYGAFERTVPLPVECDPAEASADLENGRLTIKLAKSPRAKSQKVSVSVR